MQLTIKIFKKLKEFNLDIELTTKDQITGIMGQSGSGKSMLLRCIAGIERPDSGKIILGSKVLFDSEQKINLPPAKRKVGYLFQNYALFPNMTVLKNIEQGPRASGLSKAELKSVTDEMLEFFQIENLRKRYPRELSGGEKQRVALARLMACNPDVILLDEPFSALDEDLREELADDMKELLTKINKTSILVSHDKEETEKLSDTIYRVKKGKIIE